MVCTYNLSVDDYPGQAFMRYFHISSSVFLFEGSFIARKDALKHKSTSESSFRSLFGVSAETASRTWAQLAPRRPQKSNPVHLLMGLFKLKNYSSDNFCAALFSTDRKTFSKWAWMFIELISRLKNVSCY